MSERVLVRQMGQLSNLITPQGTMKTVGASSEGLILEEHASPTAELPDFQFLTHTIGVGRTPVPFSMFWKENGLEKAAPVGNGTLFLSTAQLQAGVRWTGHREHRIRSICISGSALRLIPTSTAGLPTRPQPRTHVTPCRLHRSSSRNEPLRPQAIGGRLPQPVSLWQNVQTLHGLQSPPLRHNTTHRTSKIFTAIHHHLAIRDRPLDRLPGSKPVHNRLQTPSPPNARTLPLRPRSRTPNRGITLDG